MFQSDEVLLLAIAEHAWHADHLVRVAVAVIDFKALRFKRLEKEVYAFLVFFLVMRFNLDPCLHGVCARVHKGGAGEVQCFVVSELFGERHLRVVYDNVTVMPAFVGGIGSAFHSVNCEERSVRTVELLHDFLERFVLRDYLRDDFARTRWRVRNLEFNCFVGLERCRQELCKVFAPVRSGPWNRERFGVNLEVLQ